jgi:hypothetical protein
MSRDAGLLVGLVVCLLFQPAYGEEKTRVDWEKVAGETSRGVQQKDQRGEGGRPAMQTMALNIGRNRVL